MNNYSLRLRAATVAAIISTAAQAHAQFGGPTQTPGPLPAIPAGLEIGNRTISRQDTPGVSAAITATNQAWVGWLAQAGAGKLAVSRAILWLDSPSSDTVVIGAGEGAVSLDAVPQAAETTTVRVHDEAGNVVRLTQRVYHPGGRADAVESLSATIRVDQGGSLLPLAVVRLSQRADGRIVATREGDYSEPLTVQFRLLPAQVQAGLNVPQQLAVIPAGESSVTLPVQPQAGDVLTLRAGNAYTPAPAEGTDQIQF